MSLRVPIVPPRRPVSWFLVGGPPYGRTGFDGQRTVVTHNGKTYLGVIDGDANVRVISYDHQTRAVVVSPAIVNLIPDVHATPSILVRSSDQKLVVAVASHDFAHLYRAISTNAEDVSAWGSATDIASSLGGTAYAYANLVQLSGESGKVYLFYRDLVSTTGRLAYSTSTDGGSTWSSQTVLWSVSSNVSYWGISSDDTSRIDIIITDGNAPDGATASLYHFYYSGGSFFKSDGTLISAGLPLGAANVTKIYDGATNGSVHFPLSSKYGPSPVAAWVAYDTAGAGSNEHYWYGTCDPGGTWTTNTIIDSGSPPPTGGYPVGGAAVDEIDHTLVYVSREISNVWQLCFCVTGDGGATWTTTQVTSDAGLTTDVLNLAPVAPKNAVAALRCAWLFGPHFVEDSTGTPFERSSAQMRCYPNPI